MTEVSQTREDDSVLASTVKYDECIIQETTDDNFLITSIH